MAHLALPELLFEALGRAFPLLQLGTDVLELRLEQLRGLLMFGDPVLRPRLRLLQLLHPRLHHLPNTTSNV